MAKARAKIKGSKKSTKKSRHNTTQPKNQSHTSTENAGVIDIQKDVGNRGVQKLVVQFEAEGIKGRNFQHQNIFQQMIQRQSKPKSDTMEQKWEDPELAKQAKDVIANGPRIQEESDALYKQGNYEAALEKYTLLWSFHNSRKVMYLSAYNMAQCYRKMKDYKKAISFFQDYLSWGGANKKLGNWQIKRTRKALKAEEANLIKQKWEDPDLEKQAKDVIANGPKIHEEADALYTQGKYEEALEKYTLLWSFHNKKNVMYTSAYNMGMCYLKMKKYKKAISFFEDYLTWDGANKQLGNNQIKRAQKEEANLIKQKWEDPDLEKQAKDVIANGPKIHEEADALYTQGKYEEALEKYTLLWSFHNKKNVMYTSAYNMGMCYLKMRKYKKAISFFQDYLTWDGANKQLGNNQIKRCRAAMTAVQ